MKSMKSMVNHCSRSFVEKIIYNNNYCDITPPIIVGRPFLPIVIETKTRYGNSKRASKARNRISRCTRRRYNALGIGNAVRPAGRGEIF